MSEQIYYTPQTPLAKQLFGMLPPEIQKIVSHYKKAQFPNIPSLGATINGNVAIVPVEKNGNVTNRTVMATEASKTINNAVKKLGTVLKQLIKDLEEEKTKTGDYLVSRESLQRAINRLRGEKNYLTYVAKHTQGEIRNVLLQLIEAIHVILQALEIGIRDNKALIYYKLNKTIYDQLKVLSDAVNKTISNNPFKNVQGLVPTTVPVEAPVQAPPKEQVPPSEFKLTPEEVELLQQIREQRNKRKTRRNKATV